MAHENHSSESRVSNWTQAIDTRPSQRDGRPNPPPGELEPTRPPVHDVIVEAHASVRPVLIVGIAALLLASVSVRAQDGPPLHPLTVVGTTGLDGTIDKLHAGASAAVVKTADGVLHLVHLTDRTAVHGTAAAAEDTFHGLNEGAHVVVHYVDVDARKTAVEIDRVGDGGLHVVAGEIVGIDRSAKQLILQLPDDSWITLRLTDRAAHDVGKELATRTRVVVYYANEDGALAAHYFKKVE